MTAQTPVFGIKYIQQGEPIRATRQALQDNANAIEAALIGTGVHPPSAPDLSSLAALSQSVSANTASVAANTAALASAPVAVTLASAFTTFGSGYQSARVWKVGRTIHLTGLIRSTNALATASLTTAATLPNGYAPSSAQGNVMLPAPNSTPISAHLVITPAGLIQVGIDSATSLTASSWIALSGVWSLD